MYESILNLLGIIVQASTSIAGIVVALYVFLISKTETGMLDELRKAFRNFASYTFLFFAIDGLYSLLVMFEIIRGINWDFVFLSMVSVLLFGIGLIFLGNLVWQMRKFY